MRWIRRIPLALMLGLATTIVVSWGIAIGQPSRFTSNSTYSTLLNGWRGTIDGGWGDVAVIAYPKIWILVEPDVASLIEKRGRYPDQTWKAVPWSIAYQRSPTEFLPAHSMWLNERATGWPRLAMASREVSVSEEIEIAPGVKELRPRAVIDRQIVITRRDRNSIVLPPEPLFPGFLFNTAVYAGVWYALLSVPPFMAAHSRRRRNLCPHCRYPLASLTGARCPECGQAIPTATPALPPVP